MKWLVLSLFALAVAKERNDDDNSKESGEVCCQPKEAGLCLAYFPRWFYNASGAACERFVYGGCGANDNNFLSRCDCETRCGEENDACCQPKQEGPCKAAFPRWFFNGTSGRCELFVYGGCQGNENNFQTKCACENRCSNDNNNVCCQPKVTGPCRAAIPRWFYNSTSETCEQFLYGGCQGNDNNFESECDCKNSCSANPDVCCQPKDPGPCDAIVPRWFHNSSSARCEKFNYGGCGGNGNNFKSKCDCEKQCP